MISLSITNIDAARQTFGGDVVNKALQSTLNKLAAQGKTAVSKAIRETYNVKARDLHNAMTVYKTRPGSMESAIIASGPRLSLMYFDPEETVIRGNDAIITKRARGKNGTGGVFQVKVKKGRRVRGVTVKIRNDNGRVMLRGPQGYGGFIAQGRRGKMGGGNARELFNRDEARKGGRGNYQVFMREGKERLPVERKTSLSVAGMLGQRKTVVQDLINAESARIFQHELDFFAARVRRV